ncbi:MAG: hypothetical protein HQL94_02145 [Magnetococcales bacterium]|nr:hypothetical protein [Magnetococcales bacterium]MBF0439641.1 hypothetical protein [Magnetococcales bacterium]
MITKTLLVTCDLFDALPPIQAQLEATKFKSEFLPRLRQIHDNLALGPNPDISIPLVDALEWGFHGPIQPILSTILHSQGFDWRFITGRRRRFNELAHGRSIPLSVQTLWGRALDKATRMMQHIDL